jgi:hypothetical protein
MSATKSLTCSFARSLSVAATAALVMLVPELHPGIFLERPASLPRLGLALGQFARIVLPLEAEAGGVAGPMPWPVGRDLERLAPTEVHLPSRTQ